MYREEVSSSSVASLGYDAASRILELEFRSGAVYHYYQVPYEVARALAGAESIGQYFARFVRNAYAFARVDRQD